ncbi:sigma-70 family RNA polymerase sigma factor [Roseibacillus persicicus]|uniref:sigma-70 family RNA polymerase sigma factor n=1 Tax=Roseibacillus persicicus TaxID=454148 RepID=UPI0028103564|nr:sigma-70 family RNA polymerase sigma factor [Roseibacillus persicicus]MDQ8189025.1 sigma-70 family RNA polymerase sigma factor [Roseibacillus persicicus]
MSSLSNPSSALPGSLAYCEVRKEKSESEELAVDPQSAEKFSSLLTLVRPSLAAYLSSFLRDRGEIEDCMQEVFLVVWKKFHLDWDEVDFRKYSFTCARFKALNLLRKKGVRSMVFLDPEVSELIGDRVWSLAEQSSRQEEKENVRALEQCVSALGEEQKRILNARYGGGEGETLEELAGKISRKLPTLYKQLERLRTALRNCVEQRMKQDSHG